MLTIPTSPEWAAAVMAVLSLIVSVIALLHSRKTDRENLKLQAAVTRIEEQRHRLALEEAQRANLSARLIHRPNTSSLLVITNTGKATATQVDVDSIRSISSGKDLLLVNPPFPVGQLHAGDRVSASAYVTWGISAPFTAILTWQDPRGPQRKEQTLTHDTEHEP